MTIDRFNFSKGSYEVQVARYGFKESSSPHISVSIDASHDPARIVRMDLMRLAVGVEIALSDRPYAQDPQAQDTLDEILRISPERRALIERMLKLDAWEDLEVAVKAAEQLALEKRKPPKEWENFDRSVDELEFSIRAENGLAQANIRYVGELVQRSDQDLLSIKGFGKRPLKELKEILSTMGLHLGMTAEELHGWIPLTDPSRR